MCSAIDWVLALVHRSINPRDMTLPQKHADFNFYSPHNTRKQRSFISITTKQMGPKAFISAGFQGSVTSRVYLSMSWYVEFFWITLFQA
jgi:hypothetical protein